MSQPIYFESASPMVARSKKRRLDEMVKGDSSSRRDSVYQSIGWLSRI
jgi:hypothetical protein